MANPRCGKGVKWLKYSLINVKLNAGRQDGPLADATTYIYNAKYCKAQIDPAYCVPERPLCACGMAAARAACIYYICSVSCLHAPPLPS